MENEFERKLDLRLILSIIAAGLLTFSGTIVETSMNVAFPVLMKEFHVGTSGVQWITTGYLLMTAVVIPASSFLNRRFRMKSLFLTAVILFIIGTLLGIFAGSFPMLLMGRMIQGVSAGISMPLMYNIVQQQAPLEKMGMLMGVALMITWAAPVIGPTLGGLIIKVSTWRMIFAILLPVLLVSLVLGLCFIRQSAPLQHPFFDLPGYIILIAAFITLISGLSMAGQNGWCSPKVIGCLSVCGVLLVLYGLYARKLENNSPDWKEDSKERGKLSTEKKETFSKKEKSLQGKTRRPLISIRVFRNRNFTLSFCGFGILAFATLGMGYLLPNYSQIVLHADSLQGGMTLLPGCVLGVVLSPVGGRFLDRCGAKLPLRISSWALVLSLGIFAFTLQNMSILVITLVYMIFEIGHGFGVGNSMTYGLQQLPEELNADGNAVFSTFQQLGGAIGTAVVTAVVSNAQNVGTLQEGTMQGAKEAFLLMFVLALLMAFVEWFMFRGNKE